MESHPPGRRRADTASAARPPTAPAPLHNIVADAAAAPTHGLLVEKSGLATIPRATVFRLVAQATAGRDGGCSIVVGGFEVSRQHCRFELREGRWWVVDLDSANGTHVNGVRIVEAVALNEDDRLTIGEVTFVLRPWTLELSLLEERVAAEQFDDLTQLMSAARGRAHLEDAVLKAHHDRTPLGILRIDLDRFARIQRSHGQKLANKLLIAVAQRLQETLRDGDVVARWSGDQFQAVLPGCSASDLQALATRLHARLREPYEIFGKPISATFSMGGVELGEGWDTPELLEELDFATSKAKSLGGDRLNLQGVEHGYSTAAPSGRPSPGDNYRPPRDSEQWTDPRTAGPAVMAHDAISFGEEYVARRLKVPLVALKLMGNDLIANLGHEGHKTWCDAFVELVARSLPPSALLGRAGDDAVIVASPQEQPDAVVDRILTAWQKRTGSQQHRIVTARMAAEDAGPYGARVSSEVLRRLETRTSGAFGRYGLMVHPLAAALDSIEAQGEPGNSSRATVMALEVLLRLMVAGSLGWIARNARDRLAEAHHLLFAPEMARKPGIGLGTWLVLGRRIARLIPASNQDRLARSCRSLIDDKGEASSFSREIDALLGVRNRDAHGFPLNEESYAVDLERTRAGLNSLLEATKWLCHAQMFARDRLERGNERGGVICRLRELQGPSSQFKLVSRTLARDVDDRWCFLLEPDGQQLSLWPFFWVGPCERCRKLELFVAQQLPFETLGAQRRFAAWPGACEMGIWVEPPRKP